MKEVSFQESKFVEKFTIFASKMGNEIHLRSLRDAFATIMPLYILAGLAVLINNTVFVWLLSGDTLTGAQYWGTVITNGTLNISSLLIAPVIGYCLSRNKGFDNPMAAAIVSLAALVVMMPNVVSVIPIRRRRERSSIRRLNFWKCGNTGDVCGRYHRPDRNRTFCMDLRDQKAADRPGRQHPAVCWKII